ncbi:DMT family transporter [Halocatena salina]|uniref:EamA family transporter n=1 Tax=Halocatena salina TaxID=2934340 RepID=A0A8U0A4J5_9EURY|nr:EamA family transporter [Halocatena salina]UPM43388.1 EamA family transporter [Halocatena salina]
MRRQLVGAFLLLGTLWGSSFVAIDIGLGYFPPIEFAALRYLIAGVVVLGYAWYSTPQWYPRSHREWLVAGIAGSFLIGGHHAFLYLGQQHVSGPIAAVIVSLGPVLTALFAAGLLDNQVTSMDFVGFALGFLGVFFVAQPGVPEGVGQSLAVRFLALDPGALLTGDGIGVATVFLGAVCFALGAVLTQPIETSLPPRTVQAWAMLIGSALLFVAGLVRGESLAAIQWTPIAGISLVYLGIVTGAGAFLLYFELLDRIGPTQINLIGYLEPVSATVLSWLLLGDLIDPLTACGFFTILAGFVCIQRRSFVPIIASRFDAISFR